MTEIERKFLDHDPDKTLEVYGSPDERLEIVQGFLINSDERQEVRFRKTFSEDLELYEIIIKTGHGLERDEVTIDITREQFESSWYLTEGFRISKTRNVIYIDGGLKIEQDVVSPELCIVEVELDSIQQANAWTAPDHFEEVTGNPQYYNRNLAKYYT
jgi:CYTH domain-containing protein